MKRYLAWWMTEIFKCHAVAITVLALYVHLSLALLWLVEKLAIGISHVAYVAGADGIAGSGWACFTLALWLFSMPITWFVKVVLDL